MTTIRPPRLLGSVLLLALLALGLPRGVLAQPLFALECADAAREMIGEGEPFDGEGIARLMAETGRLTYDGEAPIRGRILVFFLGEGGEPQGSMTTEPFEMEPGTRPIGTLLPENQFAERFEEFLPDARYVPETVFAMGPTSMSLSSDSGTEFDELKVEWYRLREYVGDGRAGLGFAFLPEVGDTVEEGAEIRIRTTGIAGSVER